MCWDLEMNKVIRHYHGHLSGVYSLALHPTLDLLFTGGRDSCVRVWDVCAPRPHFLSISLNRPAREVVAPPRCAQAGRS